MGSGIAVVNAVRLALEVNMTSENGRFCPNSACDRPFKLSFEKIEKVPKVLVGVDVGSIVFIHERSIPKEDGKEPATGLEPNAKTSPEAIPQRGSEINVANEGNDSERESLKSVVPFVACKLASASKPASWVDGSKAADNVFVKTKLPVANSL